MNPGLFYRVQSRFKGHLVSSKDKLKPMGIELAYPVNPNPNPTLQI